MKAKLICYNLSKLEQAKKDKVRNYLWGFKEHSNYSRYVYERKGVLKQIPYLKLAKAVVVVLQKDKNNVIKILKNVKAEFKIFDIEVKRSELKKNN